MRERGKTGITAVAVAAAAGWLMLSGAAQADGVTITKSPDLGGYWNPLSTSGTYIYADSFVAPDSGPVSSIGIWLASGITDSGQPVVFDVFGSASGEPDSTDVLATTGLLSLDVGPSLTLFSADTTSSAELIAGDTYWVAADEVGLTGGQGLTAGGHTQDSSGINDDGTFYYSNDPSGMSFDGVGLTPEMAFTVTLGTPVPEPASLALLAAGLLGLGAVRQARRRAG